MAVHQEDGGPARSTQQFPMPPTPDYKIVDADVDYAKSTGAFPMFDVRNRTERVVEHIDAPIDPMFGTPGPQSYGHGDLAAQRADLGLSEDPSGMSDRGYEARPSTVPGKGFDGIDRGSVTNRTTVEETKVGLVNHPLKESVEESYEKATQGVKVADSSKATAKVVEPAEQFKAHGKTRATGK